MVYLSLITQLLGMPGRGFEWPALTALCGGDLLRTHRVLGTRTDSDWIQASVMEAA